MFSKTHRMRRIRWAFENIVTPPLNSWAAAKGAALFLAPA